MKGSEVGYNVFGRYCLAYTSETMKHIAIDDPSFHSLLNLLPSDYQTCHFGLEEQIGNKKAMVPPPRYPPFVPAANFHRID